MTYFEFMRHLRLACTRPSQPPHLATERFLRSNLHVIYESEYETVEIDIICRPVTKYVVGPSLLTKTKDITYTVKPGSRS